MDPIAALPSWQAAAVVLAVSLGGAVSVDAPAARDADPRSGADPDPSRTDDRDVPADPGHDPER